MLNFGLAAKGTTPHRNNGRWKENAGREKHLYCEPYILNSNIGWNCIGIVKFNSAYSFVLLLQLHCIGGTFRFTPRKKDDGGSQAAETPPPKKKRRRHTSKTLRDLPPKKNDDVRQICRKNDLYYQSWLQQCPKKRKHKFHLLFFATSFATELNHFYNGL